MSDELKKVLEELHKITNNFDLIGDGVGGSLKEGYTVDIESSGGPATTP